MSTVTGIVEVGAILVTVVTIGPRIFLEFDKRQQSQRLRGRTRDPRDYPRFWTLGSSWSLERVNSHRNCRDRARDPRNNRWLWTFGSFGVKKISTITRIVGAGLAILVTVVALAPLDPRALSECSFPGSEVPSRFGQPSRSQTQL